MNRRSFLAGLAAIAVAAPARALALPRTIAAGAPFHAPFVIRGVAVYITVEPAFAPPSLFERAKRRVRRVLRRDVAPRFDLPLSEAEVEADFGERVVFAGSG